MDILTVLHWCYEPPGGTLDASSAIQAAVFGQCGQIAVRAALLTSHLPDEAVRGGSAWRRCVEAVRN